MFVLISFKQQILSKQAPGNSCELARLSVQLNEACHVKNSKFSPMQIVGILREPNNPHLH